jgi:aspartyl-tRNA(Asn)/glutamyl-tRNA(Gln) amidotransferase subunit A
MILSNDANLTITGIAPLIRKGKISPVELVAWMLERAERFQPVLNAFITITAEQALARAKAAEKEILRGKYLGPLHGIPVSLKDLIYTKGVSTTAGSKILRSFVPDFNASVVDRLDAAGAVMLGKTNLHEFAYGATGVNMHYGPSCNPWNPGRMTGGSSGGSAVSVSAALSLGSIGSDTGGSIRIPAAACGCVGFKPTRGLIPLDGVIPLSPSLDHLGPIARSVEDVALLLEAIADPDSQFRRRMGRQLGKSLREGIRGLRIGIPKQYFFDKVQADVRRNVQAAIQVFEELGARINEVELEGMRETSDLSHTISLAEALAYHYKWVNQRPADYDPAIRSRLEEGKSLSAVEYLQALERRKAYTRNFEAVFQTIDILLTPTIPIAAPRLTETEVSVGARAREDVRITLLRLTRPANLTGQPAISLPCGFSQDGLPIGLQLIGRHWEEDVVLRSAHAYESATLWHKHFPPDAVSR